MTFPNADQMPDDRVKSIALLAAAARGFSLHTIKAPLPAGTGLPTELMIGFDHRRAGQDAVVDLKPLLERYRRHPERRTGIANAETLESFVGLVNRHKTEHSVIFAECSLPEPSFTAIIDYHDKDNGTPRFLGHRISYAFPMTEEFKQWQMQDATSMTQGDFAAFVEGRIAEISTATEAERRQYADLFHTTIAMPSDMMTLSRGLEVSVNGTVKNATKLQSGEGQITFSEEHQTSVIVPGLFIVSVPVFLGGATVRIPARLRYRVQNGKIVWLYHLYRHRELVRERVRMDLSVAANETDLPTYEGSPEA